MAIIHSRNSLNIVHEEDLFSEGKGRLNIVTELIMLHSVVMKTGLWGESWQEGRGRRF